MALRNNIFWKAWVIECWRCLCLYQEERCEARSGAASSASSASSPLAAATELIPFVGGASRLYTMDAATVRPSALVKEKVRRDQVDYLWPVQHSVMCTAVSGEQFGQQVRPRGSLLRPGHFWLVGCLDHLQDHHCVSSTTRCGT